MTSATRLTPAERDRTMARLRTLTIGSAIAGVIATAGLGSVAAVSHPGSSSDDGTIAAVTGSSSGSGTTSTTTTTTTTTSSSSLQAATTAPTRGSGPADVSTGSS